jgi:hypothetical protein
MNRKVKEHSPYQINFMRTDPWPLATFDDEESNLVKWVSAIGFVLTLTLILVM